MAAPREDAEPSSWYSRLQFEHRSVIDGLPSNWVHSILKDSQGFLWFGTHQGLARYDGHELSLYSSRPKDPGSLPAPLVGMLYEDREKRLWVGSSWSRGGLALYERECDRFRRFAPAHDVRAMLQDRAGRLWVGTEDGISRFDPATGAWTPHSLMAQEPAVRGPIVNALLEDPSGRLWVGTDGGLVSFTPDNDRYDRWTSGAAVWDLLADPDGSIWLATDGTGLLKLSPDTRQTRPSAIRHPRVRRLARDRAGRLYVGTENGGLYVIDTDGRVANYAPDVDEASSLSAGSVWALHVDDDQGLLWVGTYNGGVNWAATEGERLHAIEPRRGGLSDPHVSAVLKDRRGRLWIGTDGGGLDALTVATGAFTHFRHRADDPRSLGSDSVLAMLEDRRGRLWVGGWGAGFGRLDPESGRVEQHHPSSVSHDPASEHVWSLRELPDGEILVGTQKGALLFDSERGVLRPLTAAYSEIGNGTTHATAVDAEGGLWFCGYDFSYNATVVRLDRAHGRVDRYLPRDDDPQGLTPGHCLSLAVDRGGNTWAATQGGLSVRRAGSDRFERRVLLTAEEVTNVIEGDGGDVWATIGQDLVRFEGRGPLPDGGGASVFDRHDGFRGPAPHGAAFRSPDGEIFVGGSFGLTAFLPSRVQMDKAPPPVVLTNVKVLGRVLRPCLADASLSAPASLASDLTLSYRDSVITFEFAALSFRHSQKNRYAYQLEGFDRGWIAAGAKREATYTNLSPGQYTFRVRGGNHDGTWNDATWPLRLRVTPPFWATWWFRTLALSLVVVWATNLYRRRVAALSARTRELAVRMEERTRLARELHDTLEQVLSGMRLQLTGAVGHIRDAPEKAEKNLEIVRHMLTYCIAEARRTVMDLRSQSLEHTDLPQALATEARRVTAETPLAVDVGVKGAPRRMNVVAEHHLLRIAQEALTNAIKHSGADRVTIEVAYDEAATTLTVCDNGRGLAPPDPAGPHFGVQGMRERAQAVGGSFRLASRPEGGVEIAVCVPRARTGPEVEA